MTVTIDITDPFEINENKLKLEKLVLGIISKELPNHRIGTIHEFKGIKFHQMGSGTPNRKINAKKNLTESSFCLMGPQNPDNRKKFLIWLVGPEPIPADVLCDINIIFEEDHANIDSININVFGREYKEIALKIANTICKSGTLSLYVNLVEVVVNSESPEKETIAP